MTLTLTLTLAPTPAPTPALPLTPDQVFGQLAFMPLLVLAASLCPPGVEGTLFALLMSTFNAGGIVGQELGAALTQALLRVRVRVRVEVRWLGLGLRLDG